MINLDNFIQIVTSFFGTLGFGILFNVKGKKLFLAALGVFGFDFLHRCAQGELHHRRPRRSGEQHRPCRATPARRAPAPRQKTASPTHQRARFRYTYTGLEKG